MRIAPPSARYLILCLATFALCPTTMAGIIGKFDNPYPASGSTMSRPVVLTLAARSSTNSVTLKLGAVGLGGDLSDYVSKTHLTLDRVLDPLEAQARSDHSSTGAGPDGHYSFSGLSDPLHGRDAKGAGWLPSASATLAVNEPGTLALLGAGLLALAMFRGNGGA